jgi:hypothetical protein
MDKHDWPLWINPGRLPFPADFRLAQKLAKEATLPSGHTLTSARNRRVRFVRALPAILR